MMTLHVARLHPDAHLPTRGSDQAAGLDLYSVDPDTLILPGRSQAFATGLAIEMRPPKGAPEYALMWEAQVRGRSGLAFVHGIFAHVGTIDQDYRGEISVLLLNASPRPYTVRKGDRIAQLVINPVERTELLEVREQDLAHTNRGRSGYGSTGR